MEPVLLVSHDKSRQCNEPTHTGITGELSTPMPMGCAWATEWDASVLHVEMLPCKAGSLLLPIMKKWAAEWTVEWAAYGMYVGILQCK